MRRFSSKGSPTCTDGRLSASVSSPKPGRGQHADAADAVAAGRRAEQHGEVADAGGLAEHEPVGGQHAEAEHVHERVALVGLVEDDLAADGGHADRVAVAGDARSRRPRRSTGCGRRRAGPNRSGSMRAIGPGAHGEDVAQDAADAGGRALVGLDGRRVVVALDADGGGDAVADVDHAGVLARARRAPTAPRWAGASGGCGDDLYEQCSDHITAYMASSRWFGARPRIALDVGRLVVGETRAPGGAAAIGADASRHVTRSAADGRSGVTRVSTPNDRWTSDPSPMARTCDRLAIDRQLLGRLCTQ